MQPCCAAAKVGCGGRCPMGMVMLVLMVVAVGLLALGVCCLCLLLRGQAGAGGQLCWVAGGLRERVVP